MALIPNQPGFTAAVHPPSFNQFRMSGGVDGQPAAWPPPTGQAAGNPAAAYPDAAHSAHPELVAGGPRAAGGTAAANRPQLIPAAPATGGEGAV